MPESYQPETGSKHHAKHTSYHLARKCRLVLAIPPYQQWDPYGLYDLAVNGIGYRFGVVATFAWDNEPGELNT